MKHAAFTLEGMDFAAMDSAYQHKFTINEAISFMVHCATQDELDYYWKRLSAVPSAEQCGWLQGQIRRLMANRPTVMDEMLRDRTR